MAHIAEFMVLSFGPAVRHDFCHLRVDANHFGGNLIHCRRNCSTVRNDVAVWEV